MATQRMRASSVLRVAGVYVGSVVGAGFASGREIWSFFAVWFLWTHRDSCGCAIVLHTRSVSHANDAD